MQYDLTHLTQDSKQDVLGPIQDDEALLLFAWIRCCRMKTILEIGGLEGYSAINFLKALEYMKDGVLFTIDVLDVTQRAENHVVLKQDAITVRGKHIGNKLLDMVFFDCHDYSASASLYDHLVEDRCITDSTVLVLHDTNTHHRKGCVEKYQISDGSWVHQDAERKLANTFKHIGYDCINLHTKASDHNASMPVRHGLTICSKYKTLEVK